MEENKTSIPQPSAIGYPPPYGYYPTDDEISLVDLWRILVKRKNIIIILTAITAICALLYALLATPVYRAKATFLPPTVSDIQALNISGFHTLPPIDNNISGIAPGFHSVSTKFVYSMFDQNLRAVAPRRTAFEKMNLLDRLAPERDQESNFDEIFDALNRSLTVATSIPSITLTMEGGDPVLIADIVNNVAEEVERVTTAEIIIGLEAKISAGINDLNQKIKLLREIAEKQRLDKIERLESGDALEHKLIEDIMALLRNKVHKGRLDRILRLQEAAKIARSLDIAEPVGKIKTFSGTSLTNPQISTEISNEAPPLYTRGYEVLEAEIKSLSIRIVDDPFIAELRGLEETLILLENNRKVEQLKARSNDDAFISPLRDKEYELAWLESISINPLTVTSARVDQAAYPPKQPIKPRRKLIVVLGLMLGLMLGVLVAFFVNFIESQREESVET
jgi:LPS O-antigen subunit length determinant protein (WzzB/FepE family)